MKKRFGSLVLALSMSFALAMGPFMTSASAVDIPRSRTYTPGQFYDVPDTVWYAAAVKDCYEMGLMNGDGGAFDPNGMFTVGQAVTVAARLHNLYQGGNGIMPMAPGAWYQGAVNYALQSGIIQSGQFSDYDRSINRAQMAGLMAAALPDSALTAINNVNALPDVSSSTDCYDEIFSLYDAGVFTGSDQYGAFQPNAYITRAEVAAIVARCADPAQRVTLNLTPLSQMPPIEIPNFLKSLTPGKNFSSSENVMSNGRMMIKREDKYGYVDYKGEEVIPCQYFAATTFSHNCAVVRGDSQIYGLNSLGVINTAGEVIVPFAYEEIVNNGCYLIASTRTYCDLYSFTGEWLCSFDGTAYSYGTADKIAYASNNPLLAIRHGKKCALATIAGEITEAVYDGIELIEDSNFAILKSGSMEALAGPNGIIFNLGEYNYRFPLIAVMYENYAIVTRNWTEYAIADITGYTTPFVSTASSAEDFSSIYVYGDTVIADNDYYGYAMVYDRATGQVDTNAKEISDYYGSLSHIELSDGRCLLLNGVWCSSVEETDVEYPSRRYGLSGGKYSIYQGLDGKYGLAHGGYALTDAIYNSPEEVWANYGYYKETEIGGKPAVVYGNENTGFTPVIQFYQNSVPYDEIQNLGEGFYACRFNETWYLLHR